MGLTFLLHVVYFQHVANGKFWKARKSQCNLPFGSSGMQLLNKHYRFRYKTYFGITLCYYNLQIVFPCFSRFFVPSFFQSLAINFSISQPLRWVPSRTPETEKSPDIWARRRCVGGNPKLSQCNQYITFSFEYKWVDMCKYFFSIEYMTRKVSHVSLQYKSKNIGPMTSSSSWGWCITRCGCFGLLFRLSIRYLFQVLQTRTPNQ